MRKVYISVIVSLSIRLAHVCVKLCRMAIHFILVFVNGHDASVVVGRQKSKHKSFTISQYQFILQQANKQPRHRS